MGWEDPTFIEDFNTAWPLPGDPKSQGDDHLRSIKSAVNASFPNTTGAWSTSSPITAGQGTLDTQVALRGDIPGPQPTLLQQVSYGYITNDASGTNLTIESGSGDFQVLRLSEGYIRVTFDEPASTTESQIMLCQAVAASIPSEGFYGAVDPAYSTESRFNVYTTLLGAEIDNARWSFLRIRF